MAGKRMTKSQVVAHMAGKMGISKKQAAQGMEEFVKLAYREAKNSFMIPGLGKLELKTRPARSMIMRFGPKTGQTIQVPAKKVVKFRVAKAAKDAILSGK
jgi:DNA-binding protein HU-beta